MAYRTARVESRALGARLSETLALPLPSFAGRVAGLLRALLGLSRLLAASIAQFAGRVGFFLCCPNAGGSGRGLSLLSQHPTS